MEDLYEVGAIINEVQTISESYDRVAESTGENFNLFSILQMESDEVATHSRFIAELLNRKGSHRQKDKFLMRFIELFAKDSKLRPSKSKVIVEYHIGKVKTETGGRIDILIKDDLGNVIMIENKIYASEQANQLLRYHNAFPNGKLLFLTLNGAFSGQKISEEIYTPISYETDIISWLEQCRMDSVNTPILRETLSQYINLLKKLTNQNLNKKMNQDIINRILRDRGSLNAYKTLFEAHNGLKNEIVKSIAHRLKSRFEALGYINIVTMEEGKDKGPLISFQTKSLIESNLQLCLNFEGIKYTSLIIGFKNSSPNKPKDPLLLKIFKAEFSKALQSERWNAYIFYDNYKDWYFSTLINVYFDQDGSFYADVEEKVDRMMQILESRNLQEPPILATPAMANSLL